MTQQSIDELKIDVESGMVDTERLLEAVEFFLEEDGESVRIELPYWRCAVCGTVRKTLDSAGTDCLCDEYVSEFERVEATDSKLISERDEAVKRAEEYRAVVESIQETYTENRADLSFLKRANDNLQEENARLRAGISTAIKKLHVINTKANQIVRYQDDPNLNVVDNAMKIIECRDVAHKSLVDGLGTTLEAKP